MKIFIDEPEKEIYERVGAKVIQMKDPAMSTVTLAVIEDKQTREVIVNLAKIISMFSSPIKNHA